MPEKDTEVKILCRSPFRSGHMSAICARLTNKGKVGVQRGRKTAGCPSFLPPRGGCRAAPAVRRRRIPLLRFSEKLSARQGRTHLRQFACPGQPVQKRSRPERMNRVRSLCTPTQPVLRKTAAAFRQKRKAEENFCLLYKNTLDIL